MRQTLFLIFYRILCKSPKANDTRFNIVQLVVDRGCDLMNTHSVAVERYANNEMSDDDTLSLCAAIKCCSRDYETLTKKANKTAKYGLENG